jgi:predicted ATP-dependent endonuclease of OLD family
MKIQTLILKNFRSYKEKTHIELDDLTVFVGQNDIGKSTILEALDIFFNNGKGSVKIEKDDLNTSTSDNEFLIGVVFSNYPEKIVVDTTVETTLEDEYLLNEKKLLEIHKYYKSGKLIRQNLLHIIQLMMKKFQIFYQQNLLT